MKGETRGLAQQAARQHGAFTAGQAFRFGVTDAGLRRLVASGWCERSGPGAYRVRAAPRTPLQRLLLEVWCGGEGSVASHRSGGQVWKVPGYGRVRPELTRPSGMFQGTKRSIVHISLDLPPSHCTIHDAIPVTTPARTAFDLAGVVPFARLERDVDDLLHRGLVTVGQLQRVFFSLARRGRRGTAPMRALLAELDGDYVAPATELERRARRLFAERGIVMPRFEVHVGDDEAWIGRVDCLWEEAKVIVELDGHKHHGGLVARSADRRRDNQLMAAGWRVLRLTWVDLVERPDEAVAWINEALRS